MIRRGVVPLAVMATCFLIAGCVGPVVRPVADFTWCPVGVNGDLVYQFTSTSSTVPGQWIDSMIWEFDDGGAPLESWDPWYAFSEAGTYRITLTVMDTRGVSGTVTKEVAISQAVEIYPNWKLTLGWPVEVTGIVANWADVRLESLTLKAKFYDANGVRISDGLVTIMDIEPDERVAFTIRAAEYSAAIFHASLEVDSFVSDCWAPWAHPVEDAAHE